MFFTDSFSLVYWPDEECVSVVSPSAIVTEAGVGEECRVKIKGVFYTGKVAATGE